MRMTQFSLKTKFEPSGDQPTAIAKLVEGFQSGKRRQTLLGVTGSGKSLSYDMPITVSMDGRVLRVPIGEFVEKQLTKPTIVGDTSYQSISGSKICSLNPQTSEVSYNNIIQVSKHACAEIYEVKLDDGSHIDVTNDHNFYIFKAGNWVLTTTERLLVGDIVSVSDVCPEPEHEVSWIQLAQEKTKVDVKNVITSRNISSSTFSQCLSKKSMQGKYLQIMSGGKSRGLGLDKAKQLLIQTNASHTDFTQVSCVTKGRTGLPAFLKLTEDICYFFGLYVAEGCCFGGSVMISNQERQDLVKEIASTLSVGYYVRNKNDIALNSTTLVQTMSLFGKNSYTKRIPSLMYNVSKSHLKAFLQGIFDGDGWVEENSICLSSVSKELVFGLKTVLLRFGIRSRVRTKKHNYIISMCGIYAKLYLDEVGFQLSRKQNRFVYDKKQNTNVDLIYGVAGILKNFRLSIGLHQKDIAKSLNCTRSYISLIESGNRNPSKTLFKKYISLFPELHKYIYLADLNLRRIISITKKTPEIPFVYDIAVEHNETFAGGFGDIFVHNTFAMAHLIQNLNKPTLILSHNKTLTAQLYAEMKDFFPDNAVEYFVSYFDYYQPESYIAASDTYIEKDSSVNSQLDQMRLRATMSLATRSDVIIVASISCIYGLGDPEDFSALSVEMTVGNTISRSQLISKLVEIQYERNDADIKPGTFRVRGDVIDIIPGYAKNIIRVELFGDEIEAIKEVHVLNQDVLANFNSYILFPARHFVTPQYKIEKATKRIREELALRLPELDDLCAHRLRQRTKYDLEMIEELGYCNGIENYSRHFDGRKQGEPPYTLIDFFPDDYLLIVDESHVTIPQTHGMYKGDRSRKASLIEYGFRLPSAFDNRPLTFEEFDAKISNVLYVSATPAEYELKVSEQVAEMVVRPTGLVDPPIEVRSKEGQMDDLVREIRATTKNGFRTFVTTLTKKMAENLSEYLAKNGINVRYLHSEIDTLQRSELLRQLRLGKFDVLVGINLLREGLDVPEVALVAILDADKEGFLRNDKSLIQTCGRAARNAQGRVLFYADTQTQSMQRTISEINRRREKQIAYNAEHGIIPQTIIKPISEKAVSKITDTKHIPKAEVEGMILQLKEDMALASEQLDFERAIEIRDEIVQLEKRLDE